MLDHHAETIATAYALGGVEDFTGPVARGQQGEVWRLRTERGVWAVKRSYAEFTAAEAQRVGEFQILARAHGVPAPVAVPTHDGAYGLSVGGTLIRVQGWVEVCEADPMIDPGAVGSVLARLHQAARPDESAPDRWFTDPVGAPGWDEIITAARRQRAPFADGLAGYRDELLALEALLTPMDRVQTCHLDLWADNLRTTPDGGVVILDWDNCGPGDPSRELAMVLFEFARTSPDRTAELYGTYRSGGGPGRVRERSDFSLLIAVVGHIGVMQLQRWLDPAASEADRVRALAGIEEFLDGALTRDTIDAILSATAE